MIHDLKEEGHPVTPYTFFIRNFRTPKFDFKSFREVEMTSSMVSRSNRATPSFTWSMVHRNLNFDIILPKKKFHHSK